MSGLVGRIMNLENLVQQLYARLRSLEARISALEQQQAQRWGAR